MVLYGQRPVRPLLFPSVVDPEASRSYRWLRRRSDGPTGYEGSVAAALLAAVPMLGAFSGEVIGVVVAVLAAAMLAVAVRREHRNNVRYWVNGRDPSVGGPTFLSGVPIEGKGLGFMVDISQRFAFAKRKIDELPDLLEWADVADAVEAIRFDAARAAAALSTTEPQWKDVEHAPEHSPQAVLKARLEQRRSGPKAQLEQYQRIADRFMNRAADAAAAATVAAELGYDLDVSVPSEAATVAVDKLDRVIERLDALTDAWRRLDASTDLRSASMQAEIERQGGAGETARLRAQLDAASFERSRLGSDDPNERPTSGG